MLKIYILIVVVGLVGGVVWRGDVNNAYLDAPLGGNAKWVTLRKRLRPSSWCSFTNPVVRCWLAFYGLQRARFDSDSWFIDFVWPGLGTIPSRCFLHFL